MAKNKIILSILLSLSLFVNITGLCLFGHLITVQFSNWRKCEAVRHEDRDGGRYVFMGTTSWLIQSNSNEFYFITRMFDNDILSMLKVPDLSDGVFSFAVIDDKTTHLLTTWSNDDGGRCCKVCLALNTDGVFDRRGDGKFRRLSEAEINKIAKITGVNHKQTH